MCVGRFEGKWGKMTKLVRNTLASAPLPRLVMVAVEGLIAAGADAHSGRCMTPTVVPVLLVFLKFWAVGLLHVGML